MNQILTTLDSVTPTMHAKTILSKDGFQCSLLTLAPGDETPLREAHSVEEHLLFVIEGEATVRREQLNTMLRKDEALLIPKGTAHVIAGNSGGWTRILRLEVPARQVVTPQIIAFDR